MSGIPLRQVADWPALGAPRPTAPTPLSIDRRGVARTVTLMPLSEMVRRIDWWRAVGFAVVRGLDERPQAREWAS